MSRTAILSLALLVVMAMIATSCGDDQCPTCPDPEDPVQQAHRRGLSRPVRAQQSEDLARAHVEIEAVECDAAVEAPGEPTDRDGR